MKNEKKYLGKKKKKEGNNELEENFLEKKENETDDKKDNNNFLSSNNNENMNNDSIRNDTNNNSILISKKDSPIQLYTFNRNTSIKEENENETKKPNEKINSSINNSSAIENSRQKIQKLKMTLKILAKKTKLITLLAPNIKIQIQLSLKIQMTTLPVVQEIIGDLNQKMHTPRSHLPNLNLTYKTLEILLLA